MDRLVEILAGMVRTALIWEKEHCIPPSQNKPNVEEELTSIRRTYTLASHSNIKNSKRHVKNSRTVPE